MNSMMVSNWGKWQSYRVDRGSPPWIKVHRNLMSNTEWSVLTDQEKGQLVSIWILAASKNGEIPSDARVLRKICMLDDEPNINKFIELGFLTPNGCHDDANLTPNGCHDDAPEKRREEESRVEKSRIETTSCSEAKKKASEPECIEQEIMAIPIIGKEKQFAIMRKDIDEWQETFLGVDVVMELKKCRQWNIDNPTKRKTARGIRGHVSAWLGRCQDSQRPGQGKKYGASISVKDALTIQSDEIARVLNDEHRQQQRADIEHGQEEGLLLEHQAQGSGIHQ